MRRQKTFSLLLAMLVLLSNGAAAQTEARPLAFIDMPLSIRPGRTERISFHSPEDDTARIELLNTEGAPVSLIREALHVSAGVNALYWNGMDASGGPIAPGDYILALTVSDQRLGYHLTIGEPGPQLSALSVSDPVLRPGEAWRITGSASMPGTLRVALLDEQMAQEELFRQQVSAGSISLPWDGKVSGRPAAAGSRTLSLTLTDEEGFTSNAYHILVTVEAAPEESPTPTPSPSPSPAPYRIPSEEDIPESELGTSYWTSPVGKWDEDAIWKIMTQPLTVITGRDQRETYKLRLRPDSSSARENIVGEITYASQGVHVLETLDNGWTLVEANNSSYGPDNRSRRGYGDTDAIIRGYVESKYLQSITPRTDYGLLIDKLKQELYVFKEGKYFSTLSISTGIPTKQQPWNETPAGEYLMVSRVGDFMAGNLYCAMAMRINGGSLIHEVPYITNQTNGWKDYTIQERQLGSKASHGCVRVQRKTNPEGLNMTWLWNNIKVNTKVIVWDDTGRLMEYPPDDMMLYYNPDGGKNYHVDQNCPSIRDRYLPLKGSFTYAQLDDPEHSRLTPCKSCVPPLRKSEIDKINADNGY